VPARDRKPRRIPEQYGRRGPGAKWHNAAIPEPDLLARLAAPPVFVVGHPRSGTTWLFEALEAHPEAAGVFESWMFHERLGFAGLFDPAFWDEDIARENERKIGRPLGLATLIDRDELRADVRALAARWLARGLGPGDRYLIEKSPIHVHFADVIAEVFPEARFVEIVRDGRDAAVSAVSASRSWNPRLVRGGGSTRVRDVAVEWNAAVEAGADAGRRLGDRWLRVRFEDLRSDFASVLRDAFAFCEMPHDDALIEAVREATDLSRQETGEGAFRRGGRVGDWRTRFSLRDAHDFDSVAGAALVDLGYEQDRNWWRRTAVPRRLRARAGVAS
jgi:hypothetical protein